MYRKTILLLLIAIICLLGCTKSQKKVYGKATELYVNAAYADAMELFIEFCAYEESLKHIEKCTYIACPLIKDSKSESALTFLSQKPIEKTMKYRLIQMAEYCIESKDIVTGQKIINVLHRLSEAEAEILQSKLKYALFEEDPYQKEDDMLYSFTLSGYELMDSIVSLFYGTWHDYETGGTIEITENTINGIHYGIYALYDSCGRVKLIYFNTEEPEKKYCMETNFTLFSLPEGYKEVRWIRDCAEFASGLTDTEVYAYEVDKYEYDKLCALEELYKQEVFNDVPEI